MTGPRLENQQRSVISKSDISFLLPVPRQGPSFRQALEPTSKGYISTLCLGPYAVDVAKCSRPGGGPGGKAKAAGGGLVERAASMSATEKVLTTGDTEAGRMMSLFLSIARPFPSFLPSSLILPWSFPPLGGCKSDSPLLSLSLPHSLSLLRSLKM